MLLRDVLNWEMMCCACQSKARETSIPMRCTTLGCKTQKDCGDTMSQNYDLALQRTTTYYSGTTPYYKVLQDTTNDKTSGSTRTQGLSALCSLSQSTVCAFVRVILARGHATVVRHVCHYMHRVSVVTTSCHPALVEIVLDSPPHFTR